MKDGAGVSQRCILHPTKNTTILHVNLFTLLKNTVGWSEYLSDYVCILITGGPCFVRYLFCYVQTPGCVLGSRDPRVIVL